MLPSQKRKLLPAGQPTAVLEKPHGLPREPLRVPKACVGCRKQKTKCIPGEPEAQPCRRCRVYSIQCVFEDSSPNLASLSSRIDGLEAELVRLRQLESEVATLRLILGGTPQNLSSPSLQGAPKAHFPPHDLQHRPPSSSSDVHDNNIPPHPRPPEYPVNSANASDDEDDEEALSRHALTAPIETLNRLAEQKISANVDAINNDGEPPRKKLRNSYETQGTQLRDIDVIQRGIVTQQEAKALHELYFTGSYRVLACFDPYYDNFDSLRARSPFLFAAVCMVAARVKDAGRPPSTIQVQLRTEVENLAKEALFRHVSGLEAVQAMLLTAGWSANGFLSGGLALRMGLELGIQKACRRLISRRASRADPSKERSLVAAARLFCCLFVLDWQTSIGADRPVMLRQEQEHCVSDLRILLDHPLSVPTDTRLVSTCELMVLQARLTDSLRAHDPTDGRASSALLRDAQRQVAAWHADWSHIMAAQSHQTSGFFQKSLQIQLNYTNLFHASLVLRGLHSNHQPSAEMEEIIKYAVESAFACVQICVENGEYRDGLQYAVDYTLSAAAFAGAFLLRFARLVPQTIDPQVCINIVEDLMRVLSSVPGTRFVHSLETMAQRARSRLSMAPTPRRTPMSSLVGNAQLATTPNFASEDLDWLKFIGSGPLEATIPEDNNMSPTWWGTDGTVRRQKIARHRSNHVTD